MSIDKYQYERPLLDKGLKYICGVDEVGRGCLAGPVVACACILDLSFDYSLVTDSKLLSYQQREKARHQILEHVVDYAIGVVDNKIIDEINILEASKKAMLIAVNNLKITPEHLLIDFVKLDTNIESTSITKGDLYSVSIGAASILAKQYRDNLMIELDSQYPGYGFSKHVGYPTKLHLQCLEEKGVTNIHRISYKPVKKYLKLNNN